jgi:hypothetical protein
VPNTPAAGRILRIQPFDQLCGGHVARQDRAMPRAPARRGAIPRRPWTASVTVAAAVLAGAVPAALAQSPKPAPQPKPAPSPAPCTPWSKLDPATAAEVGKILARARSGVVVPPGAIDPPALTVGRPAQVRVDLGPDPLAIAAALDVDSEAFWGSARATVTATGPGLVSRGAIQADGRARLSLTPPKAGSVWMRMYVPGRAIFAAIGVCYTTRWGVASPLVQPGEPPGGPVLEVEGLPEVPPIPPGPEPAPSPGPEASP